MSVPAADYVIVGGGSAGCVVANRLSEDPEVSVVLLEAGGHDRSLFIRMPTALSIPMNMRRFNWFFETNPEPFADNRRFHCPRGKVLGGSSSINGMVYVRGHACDFDEWEAQGATGWGYADCLPYFRRAETWEGGADTYRGGSGPLQTSNGNGMQNPLYGAFIEAGRQAGYPVTKDYNGFQQEGFGPMHMTVDGGVRSSTARAYLRPAAHRKNLQVITGALVHRVDLSGDQATGVTYQAGSSRRRIAVRREVILCSGSIGSPEILQRSGIGPAAVLAAAGVTVAHELPGVGENLQDHLEIYFQFRCKQPISLNSRLGLWSKFLIGSKWLLTRRGLGATNHFESCAFIRSQAGRKWPDIQYHFLPAAMRYDGRTAFDGHGFQVHVGPNKPRSRGHVRIRSDNPSTHPEIQFNYLREREDVEDWRRVIALTREIMGQRALEAYRGEEIQPGKAVSSAEAVDAWVRQNTESAYHPSCTCRMGDPSRKDTVVDPECRVVGLQGLRVVDSSVFPTITNGNLNAPTIMLAEKASDLIAGRKPLRAEAPPVWIDEQWAARQRPGEPRT